MNRTRAAWARFKLSLAEVLVLSTTHGEHTYGYIELAYEAANAIKEFRLMYYRRETK